MRIFLSILKRRGLKLCRVRTPGFWYNLGLALDHSLSYTDSSASLSTSVSLNPKDHKKWYDLGARIYNSSDYTDSSASSSTSISLDPKDHGTWNNLGAALGHSLKHTDSSASFSTSISLNPKGHLAWYSLGLALYHSPSYTDSSASSSTSISIDPKDHGTWNNLGLALYHSPSYTDSSASFSTSVSLNPKGHLAWYSLGLALYHSSSYTDSPASFSTSVSLNPKGHLTWQDLGAALYHSSSYTDSPASFSTSVSLNPKGHLAWYNLGAALDNSSKHIDSSASFSTSVSLNPTGHLEWNNLGEALLSLGMYADSADALATGVSLAPFSFEENRKIFFKLLKSARGEELRTVYNSFNTAIRDILEVERVGVFKQDEYGDMVKKILELSSLIGFHIYILSFPKLSDEAIRSLENFRGLLLYPFVGEEIRREVRDELKTAIKDSDYIDSPFKLSLRRLQTEDKEENTFEEIKKTLLNVLKSKNIDNWFNVKLKEKFEHIIVERKSAVIYVFGFEGLYYLFGVYKENGQVKFETEKLNEANRGFDYNTMNELLSLNIKGTKAEVKSEVVKEALEDLKGKNPFWNLTDFPELLEGVLNKTLNGVADGIKKFAEGKNVERLYVVPCGDLVNLPVHALRTSEDRTLIDELEIAYLPPLGMVGDRENPNSWQDEVLVLEDDAQFEEANVIKEVFGSNSSREVKSRKEFVEILKNGERYRIIHISAHGYTKPESAELSWVKLKDGKLTPVDVLSLPEGFAEHVVMSSCLVGFGGRAGIDLSFGFPYAFLSRRVKSFLAPVFRVSEEGARIFFETYYKNLLEHEDVVNAYSQTCRTLEKADNPMKEWRHFLLYSSV